MQPLPPSLLAPTHVGSTLDVGELAVGKFAGVEHLPLQHTKAPHVRGGGEGSLGDCLGRHPAYRAGEIGDRVVDRVVLWELTEKTEVGHLAQLSLPNQDVAGSQVLPRGRGQ